MQTDVMRRAWVTYLIIASFAGLLAVLGVLQYRWLQQASESEGEKARKRVQEHANLFAGEFNREIQNAYFNFQTDAQTWRDQDWSEFDKRYKFWRERAANPDLIRDVYFVAAEPSSAPLRYDPGTGAFLPMQPEEELNSLRQQFSDPATFKPVYDAESTLVLPIHDTGLEAERVMFRTHIDSLDHEKMRSKMMPRRFGYLVIRLDRGTITDKLLPQLVQKHFGDGEFHTAVYAGQTPVYQSLPGDTADAAAPLFDLAPENFILYANKDLMTTIDADQKSDQPGVVNSRVERRRFDKVEVDQLTAGKQGTMKIEVKREGVPRSSVFTATTAPASPWMLKVQHSSGSLDSYLISTFRRSLAIGFGILLLLASAIAAIIISAQRAKNLAQRQVEFVSSVSHEFRTPLAVIYTAGENLADGVAQKGEHVSRYGDLIKREGKKLSAMVEQILEFAGADSGRRRYSMEPAAISDIVSDALNDCKSLIDEKQMTVETDIATNLPNIRVDSPALSRAVQNLIANSVKYSNGSSWLRISAFNGGKTVKVAVEDHGIGIESGDLKQIFEPFYRSKKVVDAQIHGNGLGLSLVRQIVKAHKGTVKAESTLGKGSKFTIELPVDLT